MIVLLFFDNSPPLEEWLKAEVVFMKHRLEKLEKLLKFLRFL